MEHSFFGWCCCRKIPCKIRPNLNNGHKFVAQIHWRSTIKQSRCAKMIVWQTEEQYQMIKFSPLNLWWVCIHRVTSNSIERFSNPENTSSGLISSSRTIETLTVPVACHENYHSLSL